ncbi:MAG: NRDE family protein [Pseudomonadota bacterium]
MCLIIFSHQPDSDLPLVVAANRDEYHARATKPSAFWNDHPGVFAGRDLVGGGTWMGITRSGRFAAITNFRDPQASDPAPRSRGELTLDFLAGNDDPATYLQRVASRASEYAGYSLLVGSARELWHQSNAGDSSQRQPRPLAPGLYGLSNANLDTPWPKVQRGKAVMAELLNSRAVSHDTLATAVNSAELANPEALKLQDLTADMDALLSAQFITAGPYGTRACTTLWMGEGGEVSFLERSYNEDGRETHQSWAHFTVE